MPIETTEDKNHLIIPVYIDRPDLQGKRQRGLLGLLNLIGWMIWIYLFVPLFTLLAWLFGYYRFDRYVIHDAQNDALEQLEILLVMIIFMNLALLAWAMYNYLRFYDNERRSKTANVSNSQIAHFYELDTAQVEAAQQQQLLTFYYDDHGKIIQIKAE